MKTAAKHIDIPLPNGQQINLVWVEGGSYGMGSKEHKSEQPIHEVKVPAFYMGIYPVTIGQYMTFVEANKSNYPEWAEEGSSYHLKTGTDNYYQRFAEGMQHPDYPIIGISWDQAQAFCSWLSENNQANLEFRLPSEAEWEYAARGGKESKGFTYAGSNKIDEVAWYHTNSHRETKPVGLKLPNELGLYDMGGNVLEWCQDQWHSNYEDVPNDGSAWEDNTQETRRLLRGGSWFNYDYYCRVSIRSGNDHNGQYNFVGFRIVGYQRHR